MERRERIFPSRLRRQLNEALGVEPESPLARLMRERGAMAEAPLSAGALSSEAARQQAEVNLVYSMGGRGRYQGGSPMYMVAFHQFFPEVARTETRSVTIEGSPSLPDGDYGFFESYCDDPSCDCRRVLINVYRSDDFSKIWATISYGWEPIGFYRRWLGSQHALADEIKGPALDQFQPQTAYAPALRDLFATLLHDGAYVERLRRHYALFKGRAQPTRLPRTEKVGRGKRKR